MAASAGGIDALRIVLRALPADFPCPIVVVQHRTARNPSLLVQVLKRHTVLPVRAACEGGVLEAGTVYIADPDRHLTVTAAHAFAYSDGTRIRYVLSSANPLFASSAAAYGSGAIAVVLSGAGHDGTDGVQAIKTHGGVVIAQDEHTAGYFGMPGSAIESGAVDFVLPIDEIAPALVRLTTGDERAA
jgi:two-component system chemotaxis response regulator CheB